MTTIKFRIKPNPHPPSAHGGFLGLAEWPFVPRVGERITFDPDDRVFGSAEVRGVTWGSDGQPTVDLHLHRAIDQDIKALIDWGFVTYDDWQQGANP